MGRLSSQHSFVSSSLIQLFTPLCMAGLPQINATIGSWSFCVAKTTTWNINPKCVMAGLPEINTTISSLSFCVTKTTTWIVAELQASQVCHQQMPPSAHGCSVRGKNVSSADDMLITYSKLAFVVSSVWRRKKDHSAPLWCPIIYKVTLFIFNFKVCKSGWECVNDSHCH